MSKLKFLIITSLSILLVSCWQIKPENVKNEDIQEKITTCWIISCEYKEKLLTLKEDWKLNLGNLKFYEDRFKIIYWQNKTYEKLLENREFQKFAEDLNIEFFNCPWDFKYCSEKKWKYSEDEMNYIFYIFIPDLVVKNIDAEKLGWQNIENTIQSIRRKDFINDDTKNSIIKAFWFDLKDKLNSISIQNIDKNKLKNDKEYFNEVFFKYWSWLYYNFTEESEKINSQIKWISEEQFEEIQKITNEAFYEKIKKLWIEKKDFLSMLNENEIIGKLEKNIYELNKTYSIDKKIPQNRFYRDDEVNIFNEKKLENTKKELFWENKNYIINLVEIKNNINLLYLINDDENLAYLPNILKKLESEDIYSLINIYEYLAENINIDNIKNKN